MGIWHSRVIDNQKDISFIDFIYIPYASHKFINLDKKWGKLGLLSLPESEGFLYPLHYIKQINVALDGRIHNKQTLCHHLNLDKEVDIGTLIIALYKKYGNEGLYRLDGAFSLILHNEREQTTLLYRSFLNGYPLYYVGKNNLLSVSTNPIDLLHRPDVSDRLDMEQISANFAFDLSGWNDTVFLNLSEVKHGEMVLITPMGIQSKKRLLNEVIIPPEYGSELEMIEGYRHLLDQTIAKNIFPNTQYGIMLSSGLDSGTLAALASRQLQREGRLLKAYSWSLPSYQKRGDESEKIKELCSVLGIELTLINGEQYAPFTALDNLMLQPDFPFTNIFSPVISLLYRKASDDGVNILFNGHYGDNLIRRSENLFIDILRERRFELLMPTLKTIITKAGYKNVLKSPAIRGLLRYLLPGLRLKKSVFRAPEWLSSEAKESRRLVWEKKRTDGAQAYGQFSSALTKSNTNSGIVRYFTGRYGIERIEPYFDPELLNYTLRLPSYMVYREGQTKYFVREAMRGLLPESIRTQSRVGLLGQFVRDSFMKNSHEVRERIFDDPSAWNPYIDEKWMEKKFKNITQLRDKDILLIWMSLNLSPWKKAIKPGGEIYEGTFMQRRL